MLDKRTFCKLMDNLGSYVGGMEELERSLSVMFDDNFMTKIVDRTLVTIGESFFTEEQLNDIDNEVALNTVLDIIYHYAFQGEFGLKVAKLQRLYVEDEGLKTEVVLNAFNSEELYAVIDRYINPPNVFQTCTINC